MFAVEKDARGTTKARNAAVSYLERRKMNADELKLPSELYTYETLPDGRTVTYCTMRQQILHCIGMVDSGSNRHKPYRRHGKTFYRPWRNYFSTPAPSKQWEALCAHGYAAHRPVDDRGVMYWMTRAGLDWLGVQLGMTIYNEEE